MSGSGISWATCKSAPRSRQITTPAPHHSVFYRPHALPATQPTASNHTEGSTKMKQPTKTLHTWQVVGSGRDHWVATVVGRRSWHGCLTPHWPHTRQWPVVRTAARSARRRPTSTVNVVRKAVQVQHSTAGTDRFLVTRQRRLHRHVADVIGKCDQRQAVMFGDVSALYGIRGSWLAATGSWRWTAAAALQGRRTDASVAGFQPALQCYRDHHQNQETEHRARRGNDDRDRVGAEVGEVRTAHDKVDCNTKTYTLFDYCNTTNKQTNKHTHTHTHNLTTALFLGLPGWASTRKVKQIWILLKQETVSGSGISWAICKSASRSRQITTPVPHHSSFLQAGCPSCRPTNSVKALKAVYW